MRETVAEVIILVGVLLTIVATIGLHRFDSVFARMHAGGKASSLGLLLVLGGTALHVWQVEAALVLAIAGFFMLTLPVGLHLLARAAYRSGTETAPDMVTDELAGRHGRNRAQDRGATP